MIFAQPEPSGTTKTDAFARQLARLLGLSAADGTLNAEDLRAIGAALATAHDRFDEVLDEMFVQHAAQLLARWEDVLAATTERNAATATRQATLTAHRRTSGGSTALRLLTAIRAIDSTATLLTTAATSLTLATAREVFRWRVVLAASVFDNATSKARIEAIVAKMKPAHTRCVLAVSDGPFLCDDPGSLTDRDLLAT
jgi:uncharacterized protein YmfQ (DUF2313 family)